MSRKALVRQFFRFVLVGGLGFLVDASVLFGLLQGMGINPYLSRGGSFLSAATFTWILNRSLTFRSKSKIRLRELGLYLVLMALGGGLNLGVYAWVVFEFGSEPLTLFLGLIGGTMSGMFLNFVTARRLLAS